jgi:uncharacterized membrane protein
VKDTVKRSIFKTLSWRLTGSASTFIISFVITGNFVMSGSIAVAQIIANTLLYYLHERVWNSVDWGHTKD